MKNNVYESISIVNVINKLKIRQTNQIGHNIYLTCPFCQREEEKNGSMVANTANNLYICRKCEMAGTSIELYAKMRTISTKEAFKALIREMPVLDNMPYQFNNPIKDEHYKDLVYNNFLEIQTLTNNHKEKLNKMGFSDEYITSNNFKSIECKNQHKKDICKKLQDKGLKLDGIPGFYQDKDFKWTYKSHNGIFVPVQFNNKIQGLRICLDSQYSMDTENIWFSSSDKYNGTKAINWPMILKSKDTNWINMYNSKKENGIIIATEMMLAHKLFYQTNKTVIGIPNNIDKETLLNITNGINTNEVFVYVDRYTMLHTSSLIVKNVIETLESQGIKVNFRVAITNISEKIEEKVA